jgi:hypothetical protein
MSNVIAPFPKTVYLCDYVIGSDMGKIDIYGTFNSINPQQYPFIFPSFVCFSKLGAGLGDVPFYFDITRAEDDKLIRSTEVKVLKFPNRNLIQNVVVTIKNCRFDRSGLYLVQLYCNNEWVADTTLRVGV